MIIALSGRANSGKDLTAEIIQYIMSGASEEIPFDDYNVWNLGLDEPFEIHKFADTLKDCCCLILGCDRKQLEDREWKEKELGEDWRKWTVTDHDPECRGVADFASKEEAEYAISEDGEMWLAYEPDIKESVMTPRLLMQLIGTECGRQILHPNIWVNSTLAPYKPTALTWDCDGNTTSEKYPNWLITDCRFVSEADAVKARGGVVIRVERGERDAVTHESESALDAYLGFDHILYNNGSISDLIYKVKIMLHQLKLA